MYEMICLLICVFAVFGGYVAMHVAVHAMLRRLSRRDRKHDAPQGPCPCAGCAMCPEKGTDRSQDAEKD